MSRVPLFDNPLLLGFDHFERILERATKASAEGYPPYNIEQLSEEHLRISLAVAGFSIEDLEVTTEDNQLIIRGRIGGTEDDTHIYLHRGIAARQFQKSFVLSEGIEVESARLADGLLHVDLSRPLPEPQIRTIKIEGGPAKTIDARPGE